MRTEKGRAAKHTDEMKLENQGLEKLKEGQF